MSRTHINIDLCLEIDPCGEADDEILVKLGRTFRRLLTQGVVTKDLAGTIEDWGLSTSVFEPPPPIPDFNEPLGDGGGDQS